MAAMDNFNRPAGGDPGDHQPTEQFWPGPGVPPGGQGSGHEYPWQQQPGLQAHPASDLRKARRWTVGIALAALLAGGGVIAGISLASTTLSATPAASTGTSGSGTAGSAGGGAATQGGGHERLAAILVTHNLAAVTRTAERVVYIEGRLVAWGLASELMALESLTALAFGAKDHKTALPPDED